MNLWVKICGNTSLADAQCAVDAGADAVGFVFAPSPRRVTPTEVAAMVPRLPVAVEKIGVFVDWPVDDIVDTVVASGLTGVQLHSEIGGQETAEIRRRLGQGLRILRVVHFGADAAKQAEAIARDANVDGILVDSRTATSAGGTGIAFDWNAAAKSVFKNMEAQKHLIAAGGLTPGNVAEAIATLRPWGVDVASGVEAAPGRKDHGKVRAFVANAREAERGK